MCDPSCLVYVLRAGHYVKVGITSKPVHTRIAALQTGCPYKISIVAIFHCGEFSRQVECAAHSQLRESKIRGEWFRASAATAAIVVAGQWELCETYGLAGVEAFKSREVPSYPPEDEAMVPCTQCGPVSRFDYKGRCFYCGENVLEQRRQEAAYACVRIERERDHRRQVQAR